MVRISNNTEHQNLRRVLRCGLEIRKGVEEMISNLPKQAQNKIKIVNWEEYEKEDSICGLTTRLVYNEFKNNKEFRSAILKTIKTTLTDRKFSEAQYWKLSDYILDEFSICYHGVIYQDDYYRMFIYPFSDSTVYFLEDIKQNKIFKKLEKRLPKEKVAMVIIN
ncbi:MAG: hypothetical protein PF542_04635 [Nanoarchaeota archaeon]|jgi:hypothetical protein|nr:hypothetical protein [Nanoarchaeota archaeon]